MRITITGKLPDLNTYINAERRNRFIGAKLKKEATRLVALQSAPHAGKLTEFPVDIAFEWHCKPNRGRHLDHDNRSFAKKFVLDGLVDAGVLPNDNPKFVGDFNDVFIEDDDDYVVLELV